MASRSSKRSRKRRNPAGPPRAVPSTRREARAEREIADERLRRRGERQLGREGERPPSPFGGMPVSEGAILIGFIAVAIGFIRGGGATLIVGVVVCTLGVLEITAREHFSGYRSHAALLAAIPAVAAEAGIVIVFGEPHQRLMLLAVVVPVFAVLFWLLRRRFLAARQARIARPPIPGRSAG